MLDSEIKKMKDKAKRGKVELSHTDLPKGGHILHGQYNTRHAVSAIPHEVCGEVRSQPRQSEVQQKPILYLLLESTLGWNCSVPGLPVPAASQSSQSAHRGRAKADPGYAPQESQTRHGRVLAPPETARLHPPPGKPVSSNEEVRDVSC